MIKIDKFPTLLAAHQADVPGPPVGRAHRLRTRCSRLSLDIKELLPSKYWA